MRTCHLKDTQFLLNQKSRSFRLLSFFFSTRVTQEHLFLHCNEFFGRTESKISYMSSLTTVVPVESLKMIQS